MKVIMMFMNMLYFASSQILVGSQIYDHNCVMDGGYTWCESTQKLCKTLRNTLSFISCY